MVRALYTAASGMALESRRLDLNNKNLFFLQTPGFKASREVRAALAPTNPARPSDVQTDYLGEYLDTSAGQLRMTGRELDFALEGEGFFTLDTPGGVAYSRDGRFRRSAEGTLQNLNGNVVLGEKGPIRFPEGTTSEDPVEVDENGFLSVAGKPVDRLRLRDFPQYRGLEKASGTILYPSGAVQPSPADAKVIQSSLEDANTSGIAEMTRTVETVRAFEAYQKILQTVDEVNGQAVSRIGRLG